MPLTIDWNAALIKITSPTTNVDGQVLHDFIEDQMATPVGELYPDIIQPEGKIEDPVNPGVFSQIIIILNSPWQVQFWGGSGYTRIYGAKLVGGLADEVLKATGTAGDITVLESPVDGLTVVSGSGITEQDKLDIADRVLDETLSEHQTGGSLGEFLQTAITDILGITGENVLWSNIQHDGNSNMTAARITQYETSALSTIRKQWDITATYDGDSELTGYQMVEV
jgi:hypothetical protein